MTDITYVAGRILIEELGGASAYEGDLFERAKSQIKTLERRSDLLESELECANATNRQLGKMLAASLAPPTDAEVVSAMRMFEERTGCTGPLRYPEREKWHVRDIAAMRAVLLQFVTQRGE